VYASFVLFFEFTEKSVQYQSHRFAVAPMMDWTDRHCRAFHRVLTQRALLYTEMVTAAAVVHGDRERLIGFDAVEHPVALQLGGAKPELLAEAARIGADFGYDEVNLNVGWPSDRVQSGCFGAALMAEPDLVARCFEAMQRAVDIPVTIKCRIGIDDQDSEADLNRFVQAVGDAGCGSFIIHARKAWLQGLSPKENRDIPPLDYARVHRLKAHFPHLTISINGGVTTVDAALAHLDTVDGVMLGRAAYQAPYVLADVDQRVFGYCTPVPTRAEVLQAFAGYIEEQLAAGVRLHSMTRHILGLFHGELGARAYRRVLSEEAPREGAGIDVLHRALEAVTTAGNLGETRAGSEPVMDVSA